MEQAILTAPEITKSLEKIAKELMTIERVILQASGIDLEEEKASGGEKVIGRYATVEELKEEYKISRPTVQRVIDLMKKNSDRYPEDAIIIVGTRARVDRKCFHDALMYRALLKRRIMD